MIFKWFTPTQIYAAGLIIIAIGSYLTFLANSELSKRNSALLYDKIQNTVRAEHLTTRDILSAKIENSASIELIISNLTAPEKGFLRIFVLRQYPLGGRKEMFRLGEFLKYEDMPKALLPGDLPPQEVVNSLMRKDIIYPSDTSKIIEVRFTPTGLQVLKMLIDSRLPPFDFEK